MTRTAGGVEYELTRKTVKNLNLRVRADGTVHVSAPRRTPLSEVDGFVAGRAAWIARARERLAAHAGEAEAAREAYTDAECLEAFTEVSDRIYPLFARLLPEKPELPGAVDEEPLGGVLPGEEPHHHQQAADGKAACGPVEYVVLHEYVHFLHPDHQAGFPRGDGEMDARLQGTAQTAENVRIWMK